MMTMLLGQAEVVSTGQSIVDAGLRDPTTRTLLVLALIALAAFIAHMKWYRPSRIEELKLKEKIEGHKANQVAGIHSMAVDLAAAATNLRESLKLTHKHLDRSCPGGMVRVDLSGMRRDGDGGEDGT